MVLSAEPDTRNLDSANEHKTRGEFSRLNRGGQERRTIDVDGPYRSVVSVVCTEALAVVRKPDIYPMVF
jgi:hypothetical protein